MLRRSLLPSIGCLGASGLTVLACSLFGLGLGLGASAQDPKRAATPRAVRATVAPSRVAQRRDATPRKISRSSPTRVARPHMPPQALVAGTRHAESLGDDSTAAPLPPTKPAPAAPPMAVAQSLAPVAVVAPVVDASPIAALPPIELPIPVADVPVVEGVLP
jgi:hypothetical protein